MEVLLVRFEKPHRVFIRRFSKKYKMSEAATVRLAVDMMRTAKENATLNPIKSTK